MQNERPRVLSRLRAGRLLFTSLLSFAFFILHSALPACADVRWNLTTSDFRTQPINLLAVDTSGVRFLDSQRTMQTVSLDQFVSLQANILVPKPVSSKLLLILNTGTKLSGEVKELKDEKLTFTSPVIGEMTFPLKQVARLDSTAKPAAAAKTVASKTEDILQLANGDTVRGVIISISPDSVSIKTAAGPSDVSLDSIASVVFADTGESAKAATKGYKLSFEDGSLIVVDSMTVQLANVSVKLSSGGTRTFDQDTLTGIEQLDGPVGWLSGMTPLLSVQTPFLDVMWPVRMDKSVTGDAIRFGNATYARGIGVHSHSKITFPLEGGYKSFRTQYAIDGNQPYADVDVRVLLDGKVVHEAKGFRSGILSPVIAIDLGTAKSITLEVDFGAGYDVQDRLNWIEPALLRTAAAVPTTQSTVRP